MRNVVDVLCLDADEDGKRDWRFGLHGQSSSTVKAETTKAGVKVCPALLRLLGRWAFGPSRPADKPPLFPAIAFVAHTQLPLIAVEHGAKIAYRPFGVSLVRNPQVKSFDLRASSQGARVAIADGYDSDYVSAIFNAYWVGQAEAAILLSATTCRSIVLAECSLCLDREYSY